MTIIVTGAAGFIGSNIVHALNRRGITDIIAVDNLSRADKFRNLVQADIAHYLDKHEFIRQVRAHQIDGGDIEAIFHQGACSDTMNHDGVYMMDNNYQYTLDLLNVYGYSKFLFDQVLRRRMKEGLHNQVVALRYFNVYGRREQHKGRMASVAYHHFHEYREHGRVTLFGGYDGYPDGAQSRDFICVEDVVKVNLFFYDHPEVSGIFNCGTGRSQPFNDLAAATVNACRAREGKPELPLEELVAQGLIVYSEFPDALKGKYQSFTQADISALREAGYPEEFDDVATGVRRYVDWLAGQD